MSTEPSELKEGLLGCLSETGSCIDWIVFYPCMMSRTCMALEGEQDTCSVCLCLVHTVTWLPILYNFTACGLRNGVSAKYLIKDMGCCTLSDEALDLKKEEIQAAKDEEKKLEGEAKEQAQSAKDGNEPVAPEKPSDEDVAKAKEAAKEEAMKFCMCSIICELISNAIFGFIFAPCSNCQMWREIHARGGNPGGSCCGSTEKVTDAPKPEEPME